MFDRVLLKEPISCVCHIGVDGPMPGRVVNVGIMGVMVELPGMPEDLAMECCQLVVMDGDGRGSGHIFSGQKGTLNWVYKQYVGIGFDSRLWASHGELLRWLEKHGIPYLQEC